LCHRALGGSSTGTDRRCRSATPEIIVADKIPEPRPLKRVPRLILSLACSPFSTSSPATARRAGSRSLRASIRHGRTPLAEQAALAHGRAGLGPRPVQLGHMHGPKASPMAYEKFLCYFLNKFKILQTSKFAPDSFELKKL
jgi:hypothetical protein